MREQDAVTACCRFGLGPRPGELKFIASDPRGAVIAQLNDKRAAVIEISGKLLTSADGLRTVQIFEDRTFQRDRKKAEMPAMANTSQVNPLHHIYLNETEARFKKQFEVPLGLAERCVLFWSNHFCVSIQKGSVIRAMAGAYEREAIRPHVFGRFRDLLRAAEQHPAMLVYLDNHVSCGPQSRAGIGSKRGLNENLAREILELHTLGVEGGAYTQEDVTSFARILTGWTMAHTFDDSFNGGKFTFAFGRHEPGDHKLVGRVFPEGGLEQGEAALDYLAAHPSTARHISKKLVAHFVGNNPAPQIAERVEKVFLATEGDLAAVMRELVSSQEAWDAPATKLRSPVEFLVATERLLSRSTAFPPFINSLAAMGEHIWNPPSPKGFSDSTWLAPAAIKARLDFSAKTAAGLTTHDPTDLIEEAFGANVSRETRDAVRRAESRAQGIVILLMSPEFQRR